MRIDVNSLAASLSAADWGKSRAVRSAPGAESATADRATFSPAGGVVQALTAQALKMPEVRQDRVDALRHSVSSGTYQLDATKTAAGILDSGER